MLLRSSLLIVALGAALSSHAADFADDFSVSQIGGYNGTETAFLNDSGKAIAPGVTRITGLLNYINSDPGSSYSHLTIKRGSLYFSNDVEVYSVAYTIYNFATPQDLSALPDLQFDFLWSDQPGGVHVSVSDEFSRWDTSVVHGAGFDPFSVTVPNIGAGIDATRVTQILVAYDFDRNGGDAIIGGIQAVPEPASMLALGVGAVALIRRRKKA